MKTHLHPVEKAGSLDGAFRRLIHNPGKILQKYIKPGMTVLDLGCGPGFFTIDIARLLDGSGKVIAVDVQSGMLKIVKQKEQESSFRNRIQVHQCSETSLDLTEKLDFAFVFYTFHEMQYPDTIMDELKQLLKPGGEIYIAEQKLHVPKSKFNWITGKMENRGFKVTERPKVFLSRAVVMKRSE